MHEHLPLYFAAATDSGSAITHADKKVSEEYLDPRSGFIAFATALVNMEKHFYIEELAKTAHEIPMFDTPPPLDELSELLGASQKILEKRSTEFQKYLSKHTVKNPKDDPDVFQINQAKKLASMVFFDALIFQLANEVTVQDFLTDTFSKKFTDDVSKYYAWKALPDVAAELGYNEEMLRSLFADYFKDLRFRFCGKRYPNIQTLPPEMSDELIALVTQKRLSHQEKIGKRTANFAPSVTKERPKPLKLSFSDTVAQHSRSNYKKNLEDVSNRALAVEPTSLPPSMSLGAFAAMCGIEISAMNERIIALCNGFISSFNHLQIYTLSKQMKDNDMLQPVTIAFLLFDLTYSGYRSVKLVKTARRLFPQEFGDISEFHQWPTAKMLAAKYREKHKRKNKFRSYSFTDWETAITQARTASLQKKNLRFGYAWTEHPNKRSHTFDPATEPQFRNYVLQKLLKPDPTSRIKNRATVNDANTIGDYPARKVLDALIRARSIVKSHTVTDDFLVLFGETLGLPEKTPLKKIHSLYDKAILLVDTISVEE